MKALKYIILIVIVIAIGYNAVYFKKLDEVKASRIAKEFNATQYARNFWSQKLMPNAGKAIEITQLKSMLKSDAAKTFDSYSHALGIGNLRYFLVKGKGIAESVNEDNVTISVQSDSSKQQVTIATEYIFGNAVRDATGLVDINEFNNTMDFNNVSAELNNIIREQVLPSFKSAVRKGNNIAFVGAVEMNKEHVSLDKIEIIPVAVEITR